LQLHAHADPEADSNADERREDEEAFGKRGEPISTPLMPRVWVVDACTRLVAAAAGLAALPTPAAGMLTALDANPWLFDELTQRRRADRVITSFGSFGSSGGCSQTSRNSSTKLRAQYDAVFVET